MKEVASGVIDGLKAQPALLALIVLNVIVLGAVYFGVTERNKQVHEQTLALMERCGPK